MPKVSILVPAYKMEKYLPQCLDSIINQSLKDIEIIVIDEGDFDECRTIIDSYKLKDSRIKAINEKNGGYGIALNKGIKQASGEYIGIVEADDFIDKQMFEDLYNLAKKHDAELCKSDFYYYTTQDNVSRKAGKIPARYANKPITAKDNPNILKLQPSIWSSIYKRDFLINNDIKFLETSGGSFQDTSFFFKTYAKSKKTILTTNAYYHYRTDNDLSSVKSTGKIHAIRDEYKEITDFLNNNPEIKSFANTRKLINQYNAYIWNLKRINPDFYDEFINEFSREFEAFYNTNEITKDFFKKVNKKHFETLLNNKKEFKNIILKLTEENDNKQKRRKSFSVRINSSRIDIVLFGKQILAINL